MPIPPKPKALKDVEGQIEAKSLRMQSLLGKTDNDGRLSLEAAELDELKSLRLEIDGDGQAVKGLGRERADLLEQYALACDNAKRLEDLRTPVNVLPFGGRADAGANGNGAPAAPRGSLGEAFVGADAFKSWQPGTHAVVEMPEHSMKTIMTESAGWAPPNDRTGVVALLGFRRPVIQDLIPQDPTTNTVVKFMRETTATNSAATRAEGATMAESALALTEASASVRNIATTLPVTEEQLADVQQVRAYIDNRLTLFLMLTEEDQIVAGDASGTNLEGFTSTSAATNGVQTLARGSDSNAVAIFTMMQTLRFSPGFVEPSGIVINPANWKTIRLMQDANGNFIWGHPAVNGPESLWGLPVIQTPAISANTALTGSFRMHAHISRRQGIRIDVGYVNDDFKKNQLTLRALSRLSMEIYRYNAFGTITSLN